MGVRVAIDGWSPEYGTSMEPQVETSDEPVDAGVETPTDRWAPVGVPADVTHPSSVLFVDGVRRIDARAWLVHDDAPDVARPGVCATVAAGAVRTDGGAAHVVSAAVSRGVFAAAGVEPLVTHHGTYEARPAPDDSPEGLYLAVHAAMTALEAEVSAAAPPADLVIYDGPLRNREDGVGYVKTHHVQYLPDHLHAVTGRLSVGERTPMFLIGGRFTRWSWYLRLPGPMSHPHSGVVRCESATENLSSIPDAIARADAVTAVLGRFASEPHKDPRAPQNLYPIAGLERELRRRLGDQRLMEVALRRAVALGGQSPGLSSSPSLNER